MKNIHLPIIFTAVSLTVLISCATTPVPSYMYEESLNLKYPDSDFHKMDLYALKAPGSAETDIAALSHYLIKPAENDWEKVRSIFTWVCNNISYDMGVYKGRKDFETDSEGVLNNGSSVCAGYANLFNDLCVEAGLESVVVSGFAKGLSYSEGDDVNTSNHAWNAVRIDNKWHLFDTTWSSGKIKGFAQEGHYSDYWFDTNPEEFIYSHFPENKKWQLLEQTVDSRTFAAWPENVEDLFEMGISVQDFQEYFGSNEYNGIPTTYYWGSAPIEKAVIPLTPVLEAGKNYHFRISAKHFYGLVLISTDEWIPLSKVDGVYSTEIKPKAGELGLAVKFSGNQYRYIVRYKVSGS